ncbi:predicted protein [Sclerotinia sclerotiorum 1980 UF-70]|uniref:Uncharacterized protein n=1 Tax=Sclerotinia sclerotiorum (strain ATCC 18683 / 1980 / Ss-1) TaxID=665079 RepID=A7EFM2_SCLS1|nr:predicted protein [Sclerotinia sclerotiorum 1980 UF-70]EDO01638.1 predicted protein [Sclerotinia sclerotiorum 1980 UF-70]
MPDLLSIELRVSQLEPPKRLFADFDDFDPSSQQPGATKRLRAEKEEAEQEVKVCQNPLGPVSV